MKLAIVMALLFCASAWAGPRATRSAGSDHYVCAFEFQRANGRLAASWDVDRDGTATPPVVQWRTKESPQGVGFDLIWSGADFRKLPETARTGIGLTGALDLPPVRLSVWRGAHPAPGSPAAIMGDRNIGGGGAVHMSWGKLEALAGGGPLTLGSVDDSGRVVLWAEITPAMIAETRDAMLSVRAEFSAAMADYRHRCEIGNSSQIIMT